MIEIRFDPVLSTLQSKGKSEFVPGDQVFPLLVAY